MFMNRLNKCAQRDKRIHNPSWMFRKLKYIYFGGVREQLTVPRPLLCTLRRGQTGIRPRQTPWRELRG